MICNRCKLEFDDNEPVQDALNYGMTYYACPYCGKLYSFDLTVKTRECPDEEAEREVFDDYGKEIVLDRDF